MKTFKQFMEDLNNQSKTPKMYGKQTGKYDDF